MEKFEQQLLTNKEDIKKLMDKMDGFGEKLDEIKSMVLVMPEKIFEKADERYASKQTEKNVNRIAWLVISIVVSALIYLVIGNHVALK